jgi:ubiquinone/menaquinone biosynthesis C-methylase UbiE
LQLATLNIATTKNEMKEKAKAGHSEKYFTDDRDHWFNQDFLDLLAQRWGLSAYSSLLDIGAGMCHWSKLLMPYLKPNSQITALDYDAKWAKGSLDIAQFFKEHMSNIAFVKGDAHRLPFKDNSFDVVTCQTVLIHLKDPDLALKEMKRVVKKGGIVICSEPSNRIQALVQDTSNQDDGVEEILNRVKINLAYENHKKGQNNGNNSFGDLLAFTMNDLGFKDLKSYLNDKLITIYPPYDTLEQQAKVNTYLKWGKTDSEIKSFDDDYNIAISTNNYTQFLKNYTPLTNANKVISGLKNQTYSSSGASLLYLISGKK